MSKKLAFKIELDEHTQDTKIYVDGEQVGEVVAVRLQRRKSGRLDTYVVFRVREAEVVSHYPKVDPETLDRLDMAVRTIPGWESSFIARPIGTWEPDDDKMSPSGKS